MTKRKERAAGKSTVAAEKELNALRIERVQTKDTREHYDWMRESYAEMSDVKG